MQPKPTEPKPPPQMQRPKVRGLTPLEWEALCDLFHNKCLRCGEVKPLTRNLIKPRRSGGQTGIENIQPLCQECAHKKGLQIIDYRLMLRPKDWQAIQVLFLAGFFDKPDLKAVLVPLLLK